MPQISYFIITNCLLCSWDLIKDTQLVAKSKNVDKMAVYYKNIRTALLIHAKVHEFTFKCLLFLLIDIFDMVSRVVAGYYYKACLIDY